MEEQTEEIIGSRVMANISNPEVYKRVLETCRILEKTIITGDFSLNSQNINSLEARDEVLNNEGGC